MKVREKLKQEIDNLDKKYLELLHNIILQFPHKSKNKNESSAAAIVRILTDIAKDGGLGIDNPLEWQQKIRKDNSLPHRD